MAEEKSEGGRSTHAERVGGKRQNRSLKVLPSASHEDWPANLGELLEWHTKEVEDVTRAAQLRLRDSAKVIDDYRQGKIGFDEARERVSDHDIKWGQVFPGGIETDTRGKTDEEVNAAIKAFRASKGRG